MTEAYWEGVLEGLSKTGAWIYFGGYLLETYSSTQQIVALSTTKIVDKRCCRCAGDPQCFGGVWHDDKDDG